MSNGESFIDKVREKFGKEVLTSTSDVTDVITTGSLALDISTGIGGLPFGRFVDIWGPDSSGKTTLALSVCKQAIMQGKKVLYIDIEQTLDNTLINALVGPHEGMFIIAKPSTGEQAFIIAEFAIESGEFSIIVFDSVGALAPEKELEDEFGDANVALAARLMTTFLRRNAFKIRINNILFLFLNQVRAKIGAFIPMFETPGGNALKHYSSLTIMLIHDKDIGIKPKVAKKSKKGKKDDDTDKSFAYGNWAKFIIKKNKVGPPHREAKFPIIWGVGIDYEMDVLEFASMLGVVNTKGPYDVFEDETVGLGKVKAVAKLKQDKELLTRIINKCYETIQMRSLPAADD